MCIVEEKKKSVTSSSTWHDLYLMTRELKEMVNAGHAQRYEIET